ncbi:MAG: ATP-binding protein [bacterium]|nr:ATP-binding protein [bacterium]
MAKKERFVSTPEHQRLIRNRIGLVVVLGLITIALLSLNFYYREFRDWKTFESNLDILLLINLNAVLLLLAIFLVLRNLIKLVYERKRRKLGFKLKSKLTLGFILVSSLPLVLYFFIANGLLRNSLDVWFKGEYSGAFGNAGQVLQNFDERREKALYNQGKIIIEDYKLKGNQKLFKRTLARSLWFRKELERYQIDGLALYGPGFGFEENWFLDRATDRFWRPLPPEMFQANATRLPSLTTQMEDAQIKRVLLPFEIDGSPHVLEVVEVLKGSFYGDLTRLRENLAEQKQLMSIEDPLRTSLTTYLLFFTFLIIFGGTWFGYYLARSIVEPIQILVEGTRRIAKGDLDFQINLQEEDEIGLLLESFNKMTKELQQNRRKLAASQEELVETNQQLEERNIFVELVVQNIQNGILLIDNSGYIKGINPYLTRLYQVKSPKILGKHYRSVLGKDQTGLLEEMKAEMEAAGQQGYRREAHLMVDKKAIHLALELFILKNPKEEPLGQLLVVDDLTEIDRSTRAKAWQEVARRIAHEIKNPLTPIQLSAQRIRKKYLEQVDDVELLDTCTATIVNEVNHLKNMVNEFSKFARLPEINPVPTSLNQILSGVVALFESSLPKGVQLQLNLEDPMPEMLLDEEQIKRVFTNLIDNAIAALGGEQEGQIKVSSSMHAQEGHVLVEIEDNGCGIPEDMLPRIFDPYVTTKKEGTGLGLAIVQQIISDHGGFIRLENIEKGTKFNIELPI